MLEATSTLLWEKTIEKKQLKKQASHEPSRTRSKKETAKTSYYSISLGLKLLNCGVLVITKHKLEKTIGRRNK